MLKGGFYRHLHSVILLVSYLVRIFVYVEFGILNICILGSFWATQVGAKNVLICSVLLWSIATFVTPFLAGSLVALVSCRIILGFAEGLGKLIEK